MKHTINLQEFNRYLNAKQKEVEQYLKTQAAYDAGTVALEHIEQNFLTESFEGQPWQEVQRRIPGTKAYNRFAKHRPSMNKLRILTNTRALQDSIYQDVTDGQSLIVSDSVYADVHNEGLHAGRGRGFTMPKRQFIGQSEALVNDIKEKITESFHNLFKR